MWTRIFLATWFSAIGAAVACGGSDDDVSAVEAAASCSPQPTPSCSPGYEAVAPSPSPSVSTSQSGLRAEGLVSDICNFVRWVCKRKQANTPGGQCGEGGPPASCPATGCWTDDGNDSCTQYSCSGVADGSPPTATGGWNNGTGCQTQ